MEFLKNPFAVYEGTQYAGMLVGFYRACCEDAQRAGDGHRDREKGAGEESTAEHDWNLHLDEIHSQMQLQLTAMRLIGKQFSLLNIHLNLKTFRVLNSQAQVVSVQPCST